MPTDAASCQAYLLKQTHVFRQAALALGSLFVLITSILDYLRFPVEISQLTIPLRLLFLWLPITWLAYKYTHQNYQKQPLHVGSFLYVVLAAGMIHCYVYYMANTHGIFYPKIGFIIILIFSGLLLALPIQVAVLASAVNIVLVGCTYYLSGESVNAFMVFVVFYVMFSACCLFINLLCTKILAKNHKLIEQIKNQAHTDELTGLYNRRFFYLEAIKRSKQAMRDGLDYAVLVIDLDRFKMLNDSFGHQHGDQALVRISKLLQVNCQRPFDFATRMGGDEFILFLYGADLNHTKKTCRKIITDLEGLKLNVSQYHTDQYITASIGAVLVKTEHNNYQQIIDVVEKADDLMYSIKKQAKGSYKLQVLSAGSSALSFMTTSKSGCEAKKQMT